MRNLFLLGAWGRPDGSGMGVATSEASAGCAPQLIRKLLRAANLVLVAAPAAPPVALDPIFNRRWCEDFFFGGNLHEKIYGLFRF